MKKISYLVILLVLVIGCRSNKQLATGLDKPIPQTYPGAVDSLSVSPLHWRTLIFDTTLVQLVDSALRHNFELRSAAQQLEVARAGVRLNKGIRLPELNAGVQAGIRRFGDYTMDGVGNYDTKFSPNLNSRQQVPDPLPDYYLGLQSSWEIDLWGKLKNKKKAAALRFMESQHGRNLIVTNLVAQVTSTWFELIAITNELKILDENIALQQNALEIVEAQMEAGKANQLGVDMMKAQLLNSRTIYAQAVQQKTEYSNYLNFLCGSYAKPLYHDSVFALIYVADSITTGIPSDLLKNRPDILQAEMQMQAANADVASAKTAFYPSININAAIGYQAFNAALLVETPASLAYSVLGGLTAPLLNRRKIKSDLMLAEAHKKMAYINYEKTVVNSFMEVYNALSNINTSRQMLQLKQQEADLLKQSVYTSSDLFKAGRAGYLEIIMAQRNALQSQIELVHCKKKQQLATINLYRSLGGGWQ